MKVIVHNSCRNHYTDLRRKRTGDVLQVESVECGEQLRSSVGSSFCERSCAFSAVKKIMMNSSLSR